MDQSTYTKSIPRSTEMKKSPLIMGGTSMHSGSNISYDFGGPSIPPRYQSLNGTFSGALTSSSLFHYPPWSFGMPISSSISIPSMVHTSQTNVASRYIQQPIFMSGMSVPIQSSPRPSISLTVNQPSVGLSMPLNVNQYVVGYVPAGGKYFVGPWGKPPLTRINPPFGQQTPIGNFPYEIYLPFGQVQPFFGQKPLFGQQPPLGQQIPFGAQILRGQQPPISQQTLLGNPTGGPSQLGFMQPIGTQILSGSSFLGMTSTSSNLPQTCGVGGTQVPIGQPFHAYTPSSHATSTQMTMGPPYQVYHPSGTQMPDAPTYSQ
jgi:hypothetical protein